MTWEYIAGFVDGEGSIVKKKLGYVVTVSQANFQVLKKIKHHSNVGNIFATTKRKSHWKESWVFHITKQRDTLFFLKKIHPHLIVKKNLAETAIKTLRLRIAEREKQQLGLQKQVKKGKLLRRKGLTYRQIGKELNLDHGYARRLILGK